ncbi:hypothetical protein [Allorhizobium taibaishanense]|uniref:SHOCT domain-containing protein n=1 Tax=Allorhizobium taibaishanense TaxID=887144 RepID=A0A1Q9A2T5_9HYPH|nr:hypothetical protein [Allorhizobium taibaishanense]MBB4005857.1 hypothetical protein [Allorhizobium taibaishanense]OLP48900.1 hypothetical protein BJF91_17385 [Allorhizobium taibaishanense]
MVSNVSFVLRISAVRGVSRLATVGAIAGASVGLLALAGCNSTAAPARQNHVDVTVTDKADPAATAYTTPDGYPEFSKPLTAANVQMSNDEAKEMSTRLSALGAQRKSGQISQAQYDRKVEEMRKLAKQGQPASQ